MRTVTVLGAGLALALGPALGASAAVPTPGNTIPASSLKQGYVSLPGPATTTLLPDSKPSGGAELDGLYRFRTINVSRNNNAVGKVKIAKCVVATDGGTCSIQAGVSVAVQVGVSLGATVQVITASLNMSVTTSVSLNVGCTSPVMKAGQAWVAYPQGISWTYQIEKTNKFTGKKTVSQPLTAFLPDPGGIGCGIA